jgi:DNA segregation ATPase FtsK/SpoIIIE-like protein
MGIKTKNNDLLSKETKELKMIEEEQAAEAKAKEQDQELQEEIEQAADEYMDETTSELVDEVDLLTTDEEDEEFIILDNDLPERNENVSYGDRFDHSLQMKMTTDDFKDLGVIAQSVLEHRQDLKNQYSCLGKQIKNETDKLDSILEDLARGTIQKYFSCNWVLDWQKGIKYLYSKNKKTGEIKILEEKEITPNDEAKYGQKMIEVPEQEKPNPESKHQDLIDAIVAMEEEPTISKIQRQFKVGYNLASELLKEVKEKNLR